MFSLGLGIEASEARRSRFTAPTLRAGPQAIRAQVDTSTPRPGGGCTGGTGRSPSCSPPRSPRDRCPIAPRSAGRWWGRSSHIAPSQYPARRYDRQPQPRQRFFHGSSRRRALAPLRRCMCARRPRAEQRKEPRMPASGPPRARRPKLKTAYGSLCLRTGSVYGYIKEDGGGVSRYC